MTNKEEDKHEWTNLLYTTPEYEKAKQLLEQEELRKDNEFITKYNELCQEYKRQVSPQLIITRQ